ncbi:hypothetical protein [Streptomyces finlayi]|nr:hypothetical protein [Streptomyces finlayi]
MPPTRALYERMITKHGGPAPTRYCMSCRDIARRARREGWIVRPGHWPSWGAHTTGSVWRAHCHCARCLTFVTIGALGTVADPQGRAVPGALAACTTSPICEGPRQVPYEERPFAWWRRLIAEQGHAILDNRPCAGLWPEGVRHDDAFLCETGFAASDDTNSGEAPAPDLTGLPRHTARAAHAPYAQGQSG